MMYGSISWQRGTAAVLAPMVLIHLAVIFYATRPERSLIL